MGLTGQEAAKDRVLLGLVWPTSDGVAKIADAISLVSAMSSPDLRQQVLKFVKEHERAFKPHRNNVAMMRSGTSSSVADQGGGVPVADAVVGLEPVDELLVLGQLR
jgi:hypothetical protein